MMMFAQRDVGFMRLRRKHLPKQRLANRMRTGSQGMGVAGGRAIHSSTIYRLGITANGQLEKGRFVAGHACGDAVAGCRKTTVVSANGVRVVRDPYGRLR